MNMDVSKTASSMLWKLTYVTLNSEDLDDLKSYLVWLHEGTEEKVSHHRVPEQLCHKVEIYSKEFFLDVLSVWV